LLRLGILLSRRLLRQHGLELLRHQPGELLRRRRLLLHHLRLLQQLLPKNLYLGRRKALPHEKLPNGRHKEILHGGPHTPIHNPPSGLSPQRLEQSHHGVIDLVLTAHNWPISQKYINFATKRVKNRASAAQHLGRRTRKTKTRRPMQALANSPRVALRRPGVPGNIGRRDTANNDNCCAISGAGLRRHRGNNTCTGGEKYLPYL